MPFVIWLGLITNGGGTSLPCPPSPALQPHCNYRLLRASLCAEPLVLRSHSNLLHSISALSHSIVITDLLPSTLHPHKSGSPGYGTEFLSLYFLHLAHSRYLPISRCNGGTQLFHLKHPSDHSIGGAGHTSLPQKSLAPPAKAKAGTKVFLARSQPSTTKQTHPHFFPFLTSINSTNIYEAPTRRQVL